ncbi:hypothetical protein ACFL1X_02675 [Candidatus Hydrogenedentota bacterium]
MKHVRSISRSAGLVEIHGPVIAEMQDELKDGFTSLTILDLRFSKALRRLRDEELGLTYKYPTY